MPKSVHEELAIALQLLRKAWVSVDYWSPNCDLSLEIKSFLAEMGHPIKYRVPSTLKPEAWNDYSGSCPDEGCSGGCDRGECDQCGREYLEKI
jgi:hypothetical protein